MTSLTDATQEFSWMLAKFVKQTPYVQGAVAVSSDGLLMAISDTLDRASAEPIAAIISGLTSLGQGAAEILEQDDLERIIAGRHHADAGPGDRAPAADAPDRLTAAPHTSDSTTTGVAVLRWPA
jgi:hypothetical protein